MSSRSKKTRNNDMVKKVKEENSIQNLGRRRSLRNSAGPSIVSPVICKKPSSSSPKSKQVESLLKNSDDNINKTRSPRSSRNSSQKKSQQVNLLSNSTKKSPVSIMQTPVRVSPRGAANGSIDSSVRRNPRRKTNNNDVLNNPKAKIPEAVEEAPVQEPLRKSNRKRCLSPEINLPEASNAVSRQPSKRHCQTAQSKKSLKRETSTHANGDVPKSMVTISNPVACMSNSVADVPHLQKSSKKRALNLDPNDTTVESPVSKKRKHVISHVKVNEKSPVKKINKSPVIQMNKTPVKQIDDFPIKEIDQVAVKPVNKSSEKQLNKSPLHVSDQYVEPLHVSPIKQITNSTTKLAETSVKSVESSGKPTSNVVASSKLDCTVASVSMEVDSNEMEERFTIDGPVKCLFEECKLNDNQKKELIVFLPVNCAGLTQDELVELLMKHLLENGATIKSMTSPRFNKFMRNLLSIYCNSNCSTAKKHLLCENALNWAKERKTVNLTHELELALMNLYYNTQFYKKAEQTANILYSETKKLQDKEKVVQACLCLSQTYHAMGNISKARANITTAKTEALKIYTSPDLQAELDLQSGIMQIAEEKDMETAYSYFKEAATAFTIRKKRARALKYMLLSKLLVNRPDEGEKLIQMQTHLADIDEGVEALIAITKAAISSSLEEFKNGLDKYNTELKEDLVVKDVIDKLYTKMLEKNLINIIKPYDKIQISYVASRIGLPRDDVERRLSQLILDGQIKAQLDHRDDCLYVYEVEEADRVYPMAVDTMTQLDRTLTHLNKRVKQLLL